MSSNRYEELKEYIQKTEQHLQEYNIERKTLENKYISSDSIDEKKKIHDEIIRLLEIEITVRNELDKKKQQLSTSTGGSSKKSRKNKRSITRKRK